MARKKAGRKNAGRKKAGLKKAAKQGYRSKKNAAPKKKLASKKKPARKKKRTTRSYAGPANPIIPDTRPRRGLGSAAAGQSGDLQGLSRGEDADSESEEELLEEGQSFEAEAVRGVANAKDPDQDEVRTHEVPEDDVPSEYDDRDKL